MKIGVLLTNTGTPEAPTPKAVRRYLGQFLSDKRIVHLPRLFWLPILYGLILPIRSKKSSALYQQIWTPHGSPMRIIMQKAAGLLQAAHPELVIEIGMHYGPPSIEEALTKLKRQQIEKLIVLPLFPQYSNTTTASTFDRLTAALKTWPSLPAIAFIRDYASHPDYIEALAASINAARAEQPSEHLLISFHGVPERFIKAGDPYASQCEQTANLLAKALRLSNDQWTLCYQSQFGYDKWLKPSTQALFLELPKKGIKHIDIVCPGFAVDCLETLEEIALRGKHSFLAAGGKSLRYIPALNDSKAQINLFSKLISQACNTHLF